MAHFLSRRIPTTILTAAVLVTAWLAITSGTTRESLSRLVSTPTASPAPVVHPLSIEAIRSRSYPSGSVGQVRDLGDQGGYHDSLMTYTSEGQVQYARVSTPADTTPADGWPVIILLHGYVDPAEWRTDGTLYAGFMGPLARAGYVVIRPDYPGHGQSQGTPAGGHFAPDYTYATLNLLASLKNYPGVNPARMGLLGHSLGGHVALRTAVSTGDVKATAILAGVVGSMYDIFYNWPHSPAPNDRPVSLVQGARQHLVEQYGEPKTNPVFWDSLSAINYVRYLQGPVQLHHSQTDSVVPKAFSDHLALSLEAAAKRVEYQTYLGDDHQFGANRAALLQNLLRFYAANL